MTKKAKRVEKPTIELEAKEDVQEKKEKPRSIITMATHGEVSSVEVKTTRELYMSED